MSGDIYHARAVAGAYGFEERDQRNLNFSGIQLKDPLAAECLGWVMHFIAEVTVANHEGISDRDLSGKLFRSTFREWQDHLSIFVFPDTPFHKEFPISLKEAVRPQRGD